MTPGDGPIDTPIRTPVHGLVDATGRLVSADRPLATLHMRAGGRMGDMLVVPPLAGLARLVRRLGVVVSRGVATADGDRDLDLWVRAAPHDNGVALTITMWTETPIRQPIGGSQGERERDFRRSAADVRSTTDAPPGPTPPGGAFVRSADVPEPVRLSRRPATGTGQSDTPDADADPGPGATTDGDPGFDAGFGLRLGAALRAPIDRIIAQANVVRAGGPAVPPDYVEYAGDIANAGRHLRDLVDDLVDLQVIESSGFRARDEPFDLADVARRAAGMLAVRAARMGVRIAAPGPDETLRARGEFVRGLQILVNLIDNAVRHSPAGGTVRIRSAHHDAVARIEVADEGRGIAADNHERVFDKFVRIDPTEPGGSGLGLYISRRLARAMGGDVLLDSLPDKGARFMLLLPAEQPRP